MSDVKPEQEHLMHLPDKFYNAYEFYQMVRELRNKRDLWVAGIDTPTACDKWAYHTAQMFYKNGFWGSGSITTPPEDVTDTLEELFGYE